MNITHVDKSKFTIPPYGNVLAEIFEKQHNLMVKYGPIEEANGFPRPKSTSLDDAQLQFKIKDFFWRATEEIAESYEALVEKDTLDLDHVQEELIDALHFLVEAAHLSGVDHTIGTDFHDILHPANKQALTAADRAVQREHQLSWMTNTVMSMGIAANCFKNKPWKSTHMATDIDYYHTRLRIAFVAFAKMLKAFRLDIEDVYILYCCKNEVNQFRQRSNY